MGLVRKELLVPETSGGQDDVFRFGHILIRDAAYDAVPKKVRAQLHEELARWLEQRDAPAPDEIVGYHLEQAYFARSELGLPDAELQRLARRAAGVLASAGSRALSRAPVRASLASGSCSPTMPPARQAMAHRPIAVSKNVKPPDAMIEGS